MYDVFEADRVSYPYEVFWHGGIGKALCRCKSYRDANRIALALNICEAVMFNRAALALNMQKTPDAEEAISDMLHEETLERLRMELGEVY